jgi:hypothetical protein
MSHFTVTVNESPTTVSVNETTHGVSVVTQSNTVTVTDPAAPTIVEVATVGPQGPTGATGQPGPSGAAFGISIDGGGVEITTGIKNDIIVPFGMTITGWWLTADQVGNIVIDVWKDTYGNYPPTGADSIAGTEKPTLVGSNKAQDLSLSTWTTAVSAGDVLRFNVESVSSIQRVTLVLQGNKT